MLILGRVLYYRTINGIRKVLIYIKKVTVVAYNSVTLDLSGYGQNSYGQKDNGQKGREQKGTAQKRDRQKSKGQKGPGKVQYFILIRLNIKCQIYMFLCSFLLAQVNASMCVQEWFSISVNHHTNVFHGGAG